MMFRDLRDRGERRTRAPSQAGAPCGARYAEDSLAAPPASMTLRPLLAASAVLLIALPARAERPQDAATLTYLPSRATVALCPAADFLALEVRIRLGYELFQPSARSHLTVKVERANGLFRSTGELRDDDGNVTFTRDFSEVDCTAAVVSMAISVAIKFMRPPEEPEPPAPSPPAPAAPTCPPAPEPAAPEPPKPAAPPFADRPSLQAGLASVFSIGVAPVVVGGVAGFGRMRWKTVSLQFEGNALFAPSATIENFTPSTGYHYFVATAAGLGCYHARWAFACARTEASVLSISHSTTRFTGARTASLGFGLGFGAEWAFAPGFSLRAYSDFLLRPLASLLGDGTKKIVLWPGSSVSGSVGLGPVLSF